MPLFGDGLDGMLKKAFTRTIPPSGVPFGRARAPPDPLPGMPAVPRDGVCFFV